MRLYYFVLITSFISGIYGFSFTSLGIKTRFNNIPFNYGLRHIHYPEHISDTHKLGAPLFRIDKVSPPTYYNGIPRINFNCSLMSFINMEVDMISRYRNRCEMIFSKNKNELFGLKITILPDLDDKDSHYLYIQAYFPETYLSELLMPFIGIFFQFSLIISKYEDIFLLYKNKNKNKIIHNENFNKYRKLIFTNKNLN